MFPDGFDAFWAPQAPIGSLITLREGSRCLVACKGGGWGLSRFWAIWGENPKNWLWGPVEAVSAKFSCDIKVVHGDSATDEPKKSRF